MYFRDRMVRGAAMVTGPNRLDPTGTSRKLWTMPLEFQSTCPIPIFSCSNQQLVWELAGIDSSAGALMSNLQHQGLEDEPSYHAGECPCAELSMFFSVRSANCV
jgi:hypothetical protein